MGIPDSMQHAWLDSPALVAIYKAVAIGLLIVIATHGITAALFASGARKGAGTVPTVPFMLPFFGHTWTFAMGGNTFGPALLAHVQALKKYALAGAPIRLKGVGFNFILLSGDQLISKAFVSSRHLDWGRTSALVFRNIFAGPKRLSDAHIADDSGIGIKPYPGSNVDPSHRIARDQRIFFDDLFSKRSMDELVPRFLSNLALQCSKVQIGADWTEMDDLYSFIRDLVFPSALRAFLGERILALNPNLQKDFEIFDSNLLFFATGMPTWLKPQASRARLNCLAAMKKWRQEAVRQTSEIPSSNDVTWDPAWGLGAIHRRNRHFAKKSDLYDEDGLAAQDLVLLWVFMANALPASFWFIFEILAGSSLHRAKSEVNSARTMSGSIDPAKLISSNFLQSVYSETLRVHNAAILSRTVKQTFSIEGWVLPKHQSVMVSSHIEHRSPGWDTVDACDNHHPAEEFWAERFLKVGLDGKETFSTREQKGKWIPYGMGEHMCPGRHFAKYELMISFAVLMENFDIELLIPNAWKPEDDLKRYGTGSLPPKQEVKFRIRKRSDE